jgi:aspartyl-tRNA(Asn)/glutamyl-tRNA(Gln) amidotransferase subunit A
LGPHPHTEPGPIAQSIAEALARIELNDHAIHSFIEVHAERAMNAARTLDHRLAGGDRLGPLAGLPVAHKDIFYRKDRPPTCGARDTRGFPRLPSSPLPDRLAESGAVELGVLNLAEFCFGTTGSNEAFGDVRNPWDASRIVGASSSGSGAAVAAGFIAASLGTDSGGSVRVPAALCGVVGLKPTHGILPTIGVFPMVFSLDCVGILARSVASCRAVYEVAAGRTATPALPRPLRIGLPRNFYMEGLDDAVASAFDDACRALQRTGAELVERQVPESDEMGSLLRLVMRSEGAAIHARLMAERPGNYPLSVRKFLESGLHIGARDYIDALRMREHFLERSLKEVFVEADLLLTPTVPIVAPRYADVSDAGSERGWRAITMLARCTQPATYMGLPALSVPFGESPERLPVGLQLIAPPHREDLLFAVAELLEASSSWPRRLPPLQMST